MLDIKRNHCIEFPYGNIIIIFESILLILNVLNINGRVTLSKIEDKYSAGEQTKGKRRRCFESSEWSSFTAGVVYKFNTYIIVFACVLYTTTVSIQYNYTHPSIKYIIIIIIIACYLLTIHWTILLCRYARKQNQ